VLVLVLVLESDLESRQHFSRLKRSQNDLVFASAEPASVGR